MPKTPNPQPPFPDSEYPFANELGLGRRSGIPAAAPPRNEVAPGVGTLDSYGCKTHAAQGLANVAQILDGELAMLAVTQNGNALPDACKHVAALADKLFALARRLNSQTDLRPIADLSAPGVLTDGCGNFFLEDRNGEPNPALHAARRTINALLLEAPVLDVANVPLAADVWVSAHRALDAIADLGNRVCPELDTMAPPIVFRTRLTSAELRDLENVLDWTCAHAEELETLPLLGLLAHDSRVEDFSDVACEGYDGAVHVPRVDDTAHGAAQVLRQVVSRLEPSVDARPEEVRSPVVADSVIRERCHRLLDTCGGLDELLQRYDRGPVTATDQELNGVNDKTRAAAGRVYVEARALRVEADLAPLAQLQDPNVDLWDGGLDEYSRQPQANPLVAKARQTLRHVVLEAQGLLASQLAEGPPAGEQEARGADEPSQEEPKPDCSHSPCFTSVTWYGAHLRFSKRQAAIIEQLWRAWDRGNPTLSGEVIAETIFPEGDSPRRFHLPDYFRKKVRRPGKKKSRHEKHPAMDHMIHEAGKGIWCLGPPPHNETVSE